MITTHFRVFSCGFERFKRRSLERNDCRFVAHVPEALSDSAILWAVVCVLKVLQQCQIHCFTVEWFCGLWTEVVTQTAKKILWKSKNCFIPEFDERISKILKMSSQLTFWIFRDFSLCSRCLALKTLAPSLPSCFASFLPEVSRSTSSSSCSAHPTFRRLFRL